MEPSHIATGVIAALAGAIITWLRHRNLDQASVTKTHAEATHITNEDVRQWTASAMAAERKLLEQIQECGRLQLLLDECNRKVDRYKSGNGR